MPKTNDGFHLVEQEKNNEGVEDIKPPKISLPEKLELNSRLKMDGFELLSKIPENAVSAVFFDPQYRGILDKMKYGNEGEKRGQKRCELTQMSEETIKNFIVQINKILTPSGHLFLWIDKFHLCQGVSSWLPEKGLEIVDLIVWNKLKMGMGYRTRRCSEYLMVIQKLPKRAKDIWKIRNIRDVWDEKIENIKEHTHKKPINLQKELIKSISNEGDIIVDPSAGSFSVMKAANQSGRNFLGCDING